MAPLLGILGVLCIVALMQVGISGQRAPCYECELFKEEHPESHPYEEIRSHCTYPCECPVPPSCRDGVHLITDGCGCCRVCARQQGDLCDGTHLCDEEKGLVCEYSSENAPTGTCKAIKGASCMVGNKTYEDGESFTPDCRTQCTCQNGTYGCVSLCTRENLLPSTGCINPRLVPVAGKCCREWMCDTNVLSGPKCRQVMGEWSLCSVSCGVGVSVRLSNDNAECLLRNETRLCQVRPCDLRNVRMNHMTRHHIRKGHTCKATVRSSWPMRIRHGNCTSVRPLHLKFCGICGGDICCSPITSDTRMEEFDCGPSPSARLNLALMSIKRCQCSRCPHSSWHRDS